MTALLGAVPFEPAVLREVPRLAPPDFACAVAVPWLLATLGVLNLPAVGVEDWACPLGLLDVGDVDAGAETLNDAGAKPPVGRDAVIV